MLDFLIKGMATNGKLEFLRAWHEWDSDGKELHRTFAFRDYLLIISPVFLLPLSASDGRIADAPPTLANGAYAALSILSLSVQNSMRCFETISPRPAPGSDHLSLLTEWLSQPFLLALLGQYASRVFNVVEAILLHLPVGWVEELSRAVCHQWRNPVPTADIPLACYLLLEFYLGLIEGKYFHQTRPWVLDNLRDFDRESYVAALVQQDANSSEEFRLWFWNGQQKPQLLVSGLGYPATW
ncbi:hypothetical protein M422DRAFT_264135 [Sphaerobolus stellatus SS14]|uniref:Uncharacterized protein n=1 Tax=Sphaerobolus stellatus (strain SS14) TaxID=990650 RepID=A0A0C9UGE6_SPHS4|nr:hypothetical protein M422DRAFT_264135 [Sphaerobolus stellatus SS14]